MTQRRSKGWLATLLLTLPVLGACGGLTDGEPATRARVVADVDPAEPLTLIISTDFTVVLEPNTGELHPDFDAADTFDITSPFDQTYSLNPNDSRLFVRLANDGAANEPVHLQVLLDGRSEYDVEVTMANGAFLEYLYRFNQARAGGG